MIENKKLFAIALLLIVLGGVGIVFAMYFLWRMGSTAIGFGIVGTVLIAISPNVLLYKSLKKNEFVSYIFRNITLSGVLLLIMGILIIVGVLPLPL